MSSEAFRRILHLSSATVLLLVPLGSWTILRMAVTSVSAIAISVDFARLRVPAFAALLTRFVPAFRAEEATRWSGATWLWLGYTVAVWMPAPAGVGAILATAIADPSAAWAGTLAGTRGKSWIGSAAHFATGLAALLVVGWAVPQAIVGALVGMTLEHWCGSVNDNLLVPPGLALTYWVVA